MKSAGDKLDGSDKAAVEADLKSMKDILSKHPDANAPLEDADIDEMKAAKEKLMESAQKLFAKMYEQAQQNQQGGPQGGPDMGGQQGSNQSNGGNDDDVVDADYKEV